MKFCTSSQFKFTSTLPNSHVPASQYVKSISQVQTKMSHLFKCVWVILILVVPVLKSDAAYAPWLAAAAGADAAGRTTPVAVGMRSGSRRGDAAGEKEGLCLRTQGATDLTAPGRLEQETDEK